MNLSIYNNITNINITKTFHPINRKNPLGEFYVTTAPGF